MYELKVDNSYIITWDYEDEININNRKIKFVPLWMEIII